MITNKLISLVESFIREGIAKNSTKKTLSPDDLVVIHNYNERFLVENFLSGNFAIF